MTALTYRGGKKRVAGQIIDICPRAQIFIDVFGGGGSVAIAAAKSGKYYEVIYNDLDKRLLEYFEVCRDNLDEFVEYLNTTPLGRTVFDDLNNMFESDNKVIRAAATYYSCNFQGKPITEKGGSCWFRPSASKNGGSISRGVNTHRQHIKNFIRDGNIKLLEKIYLENRDAMRIIELYGEDSTKLVFFLDPPYGRSGYRHDFTESDRTKLVEFFLTTEHPVLLCGLESEYTELDGCDYLPFNDSHGKPLIVLTKNNEFRQGMWLRNIEREKQNQTLLF